MVKRTREVLLVALVLFFWVSYTAFAQTEEPISNYQTIYDSMVSMEDVLERQLDEANVSFGYVPGFGSVFICEVQGNLENVDQQVRELITFFGPLIEMEDKENVCVVVKYGGELKTEEYVIIAPKIDITDIEGWEILDSAAQAVQVIKNITVKEANDLIESKHQCVPCERARFVIMDVRTPEEYAKGHLEKAINLDYRSKTFKDDLNKLDKNKVYLIYCRSGGRSAKVLDIMKELGFTEAYNVLGGITQWEAEGLPIIK